MINATLRFVDYMSGIPFSSADVSVSFIVYPIGFYKVKLPFGIGKEIEIELPRFIKPTAAAGASSVQVRTNSEGIIQVSQDLSAAFTQMRQAKDSAGKIADDATAKISVEVRLPWLEFDPSIPFFRVANPYYRENDNDTRTIDMDYVRVIVGDTKQDTAILWFQIQGRIKQGYECVCEVELAGLGNPVKTLPVVFTPPPTGVNTAALTITGLIPASKYRYTLKIRQAQQTVAVLAQECFTTAPPESSTSLQFVFGSCNFPFWYDDNDPLERWRALANRNDYDFMLLIGDQIYGDGLSKVWPAGISENDKKKAGEMENAWFRAYAARYEWCWRNKSMRQVMRRTPTYMILDDHEVADDWGTIPLFEGDENDVDHKTRIRGALRAYRIFQHSHNPQYPVGSWLQNLPLVGQLFSSGNPPLFYDFTRGPASFFVMDGRTQRSLEPEKVQFPILGPAQAEALRAWSLNPKTRNSDIIFFVAPVPIAFLPVEEIQRIIQQIKSKTSGADSWGLALRIGFDVLTLGTQEIAGPLGDKPISEYIIPTDSRKKADDAFKKAKLVDLTDRDLADMWTWGPNQKEAKYVLDLLFDLANDIQPDGKAGKRPRAVFILGGDVHSGSMHVIHSHPQKTRYKLNSMIHHLTSSGISQKPVDDTTYARVIKTIKSGVKVSLSDLKEHPKFDELLPAVISNDPARFFINDKPYYEWQAKIQGGSYTRYEVQPAYNAFVEQCYEAEFVSLLFNQRNFGRVQVERVRQDRRVYRFSTAIEGTTSSISQYFELDLDATPVAITDLAKSFLDALEWHPGITRPVSMLDLHKRFGVVPPLSGRSLLTKMAPKRA